MIYELKKDQFSKIAHLLEGERINLEVKAVVNGNNPGWIFVDNIELPKTSMIWSRGIEGFYFIGDAFNKSFNNNIVEYLENEIAKRAKKMGLNYFEFSGTSVDWDQSLVEIFEKQELGRSKQFVYVNENIDEKTFCDLKLENYTLRAIDESLLLDRNLNLEYVESAINEWWDSTEDFIKLGTGYCILHNNVAVCSCLTSFRSDRSMESHIKTMEKHRKRGLAKIAVSEFLKYCKENNYLPYWDCMEDNYGSRALAEHFGYIKKFEYFLYFFDFQ